MCINLEVNLLRLRIEVDVPLHIAIPEVQKKPSAGTILQLITESLLRRALGSGADPRFVNCTTTVSIPSSRSSAVQRLIDQIKMLSQRLTASIFGFDLVEIRITSNLS
jgi:hypothetical protein